MTRERVRGYERTGASGEPLDSPLFRVRVLPDGQLDHSQAYDPKYTAECEKCETRYPIKEGHECPPQDDTTNTAPAESTS